MSATGYTGGDPTKVDVAGDTMSGVLVVNATSNAAPSSLPAGYGKSAAHTGISIPSTFAGGEDDGTGSDSTGRLNLYSFQRAQDDSYGETIRHFLMRADAKAANAWYFPRAGYDATTEEPNTSQGWRPQAWVIAHAKANDGLSYHNHLSFEVMSPTNGLVTRLEIPFVDQETWQPGDAYTGVETTNICTADADLSIRAAGGRVLRVGGSNTYNKDILLSISSDRATSGRRWAIRANSTTEAGANAGTDFQLLAYDDSGVEIAPRLHIARSTGNIGFGTTSVSAAHVSSVWGTSGVHGYYAAPSSSPGSGAAYAGLLTASTDRLFDFRVSGDSNARLVVLADGKVEWGSGAAGRDTNLYRLAADSLATDDKFTSVGLASTTNGATAAATFATSADGTASGGVVVINPFSTSKRALDIRLTADTVSRLRVDMSASGSGTVLFGDGTTVDTNIYRSAANVLKTDDSLHVALDLRHLGTNLGFYNATAVAKQTVSGSTGGNAALQDLLAKLATLGLITNSTT